MHLQFAVLTMMLAAVSLTPRIWPASISRSIASEATRALSFLRKANQDDIKYVVDLYEKQGICGDASIGYPFEAKEHLEYLVKMEPNTFLGYVIESAP